MGSLTLLALGEERLIPFRTYNNCVKGENRGSGSPEEIWKNLHALRYTETL